VVRPAVEEGEGVGRDHAVPVAKELGGLSMAVTTAFCASDARECGRRRRRAQG
jgi:hypothetical protein